MIVRQLPSLFLKDASGPPVSPSGKIRRIPQESSRESSQQNPCSAQTLISITFHINVRPVVRLSKTPLVGLPWEQNRATLLRYVRFAQRESVRGAKPDPNRIGGPPVSLSKRLSTFVAFSVGIAAFCANTTQSRAQSQSEVEKASTAAYTMVSIKLDKSGISQQTITTKPNELNRGPSP